MLKSNLTEEELREIEESIDMNEIDKELEMSISSMIQLIQYFKIIAGQNARLIIKMLK